MHEAQWRLPAPRSAENASWGGKHAIAALLAFLRRQVQPGRESMAPVRNFAALIRPAGCLGWLAVGTVALVCGCSKQDTERLARVGRTAAVKAQNMMGGAQGKLANGIEAVRGDVDGMALDVRVAARLRWDKVLSEVKIHVSARNGDVELKGKIYSQEQRNRALDLALSTTGATNVTDKLEIVTPDQ